MLAGIRVIFRLCSLLASSVSRCTMSSGSAFSCPASSPSFSDLRLANLEVVNFHAPPYSHVAVADGAAVAVGPAAGESSGAGVGGAMGRVHSTESVVIPAVGGDGIVVLPRRPSRLWASGSLFPLAVAEAAVENILSWWRPGPCEPPWPS